MSSSQVNTDNNRSGYYDQRRYSKTASTKIVPFENASKILRSLQKGGNKIVQCHGTFDLIHPGHIAHLQKAKQQGDILVVTFTAATFVNKGPGRPLYNDQQRSQYLAALECIDYVICVPFAAAIEAISCVNPDIYCKGKEYSNSKNDPTGNIHDDISTVEQLGGKVVYIGDTLYSSSKLLNLHFPVLPPEVENYCAQISKSITPNAFRDLVDELSKLKVLIIGDLIFDKYTYLKVQGLTSKNRILSGRYLNEEIQLGGALAVYRHVRQFTSKVDLVSLAGIEPWVKPTLSQILGNKEHLIYRDPEFTTIIKQRYISQTIQGKELEKLFSVNYINEHSPSNDTISRLESIILKKIKNYDLIMVTDFGHGLLQKPLRELIQNESKFMSLNCQTNSYNHGFNIINYQYQRADAFSLDEQELELASGSKARNFSYKLGDLRSELNSKFAWLTRGPIETIGLDSDGKESICPPLEQNARDTIGAGDAFFCLASLAAAGRHSIDLSTFLGQLAGSLAIQIEGNKESIAKASLIKSGMTLLNR